MRLSDGDSRTLIGRTRPLQSGAVLTGLLVQKFLIVELHFAEFEMDTTVH